jgi:hypothetical protein
MGYFAARPRPDDHLIVDGGPHGFLNGGHAHADALSLVYTVNGCPLAIDPGTFTYTMAPAWRDRLRSSTWHNTLTLDRRSQSVPRGPFHWEHTATAYVQARMTGEESCYFEGAHDGYLPVVHRRRVAALPSGLLVVVDSVLGSGRHLAEVHWHLDPAWKASRDADGRIALEHADRGGRVDLITSGADLVLFAGDEASGLGWHSPVYGRLVPCTTARLAADGALPLVIVSVFAERRGAAVRVECTPSVDSASDGPDDSLAVQLHAGGAVETLLFTDHPLVLSGNAGALATGPAITPTTRRFVLEGVTFVTDARFAWLTSGVEGRASLRAVVGGTAEIEESHVRHCRIRRG